MANKISICGIDTSSLPRATNDELISLLEKIKEGDDLARDKFVMYNIRLVLSICGRFATTKNNVDDVFQVGMIGLIKAMDNFDLSVGVRFSTYAVPMIIGEIRRFIRDSSSLKVTRSLREIAYQALTIKESLQKNMDNNPTVEDIALEMKIPTSEVAMALDAIADPISIYESAYNDEESSLLVLDQIHDPSCEEKLIEQTALKQAIESLSPREREILNLRYFMGKTQMEISDEIGISQAQVSRLEKDAIKTLSIMSQQI